MEKEKYKKTLLVVKTSYFETFGATEVTELNRIESNWADFEGDKKWAKNQQIGIERGGIQRGGYAEWKRGGKQTQRSRMFKS